jgi:hypothetical protein
LLLRVEVERGGEEGKIKGQQLRALTLQLSGRGEDEGRRE